VIAMRIKGQNFAYSITQSPQFPIFILLSLIS
jgi:hypothetical protein